MDGEDSARLASGGGGGGGGSCVVIEVIHGLAG